MRYVFPFCLLVGLVGCGGPETPTTSVSDASAETESTTGSESTAPEPVAPKPEPIELSELPEPEGEDGTFTIAQVMQEAHDNKLYRSLFKTPVDSAVAERLTLLYASLPLQTPPEGEDESWQQRSTALVTAAQMVIDGDPKGAAAIRKAVNCNSCHSRHKG